MENKQMAINKIKCFFGLHDTKIEKSTRYVRKHCDYKTEYKTEWEGATAYGITIETKHYELGRIRYVCKHCDYKTKWEEFIHRKIDHGKYKI